MRAARGWTVLILLGSMVAGCSGAAPAPAAPAPVAASPPRLLSTDELARWQAQRRVVLPFIRDWADSAGSITATQLFVASQQSHLLRVATVRATAAFDYVLSPVAPITAFHPSWTPPTSIERGTRTLSKCTAWCVHPASVGR